MDFLVGLVYLYFIAIPLGVAFVAGYILGEKLTKLEAGKEAS